MVSLVNALLDLWDPYGLYLFPRDEYTSYALDISEFLKNNRFLEETDLAAYVFKILPPIIVAVDSKVEYERFAKALLLVLKNYR